MDGVCFGDLQYVLYDRYINLNIIRQLKKPFEKTVIGSLRQKLSCFLRNCFAKRCVRSLNGRTHSLSAANLRAPVLQCCRCAAVVLQSCCSRAACWLHAGCMLAACWLRVCWHLLFSSFQPTEDFFCRLAGWRQDRRTEDPSSDNKCKKSQDD